MNTNEALETLQSNSSPLVSVIMPAFNTADYIAEAIESALSQTIQDIEVIVVDDASSDNTAEVAEGLKDPRVKVIRLPQNGGAAVARNRALEEARGVWVAVLDSDDWYAFNRLEILLEVANDHAADMVADDLYYIESRDSSPWTTHIQRSGETITQPTLIDSVTYVLKDVPEKKGLHLGFSKPLVKREFLVKHNIRYEDNIRLGQDFFIYLRALVHGAKFIFYPKPLYYYRYRARPDSLVMKSQLSRLEQSCWGIHHFLNQDIVQSNPELVKALNYKLRVCQRLRAYYRVVEPLKKGVIHKALLAMIQNPYFFVRFFMQIPRILIALRDNLLPSKNEASHGTSA